MHKIKKGDLVKVITGKDKDKTGKVLSVNVKKNTVLVEGCNMVTKHTKPSAANQQGGIIHQEGALDISNVMLVVDGKATRAPSASGINPGRISADHPDSGRGAPVCDRVPPES